MSSAGSKHKASTPAKAPTRKRVKRGKEAKVVVISDSDRDSDSDGDARTPTPPSSASLVGQPGVVAATATTDAPSEPKQPKPKMSCRDLVSLLQRWRSCQPETGRFNPTLTGRLLGAELNEAMTAQGIPLMQDVMTKSMALESSYISKKCLPDLVMFINSLLAACPGGEESRLLLITRQEFLTLCQAIQQTMPRYAGAGALPGVLWFQLLLHTRLMVISENHSESSDFPMPPTLLHCKAMRPSRVYGTCLYLHVQGYYYDWIGRTIGNRVETRDARNFAPNQIDSMIQDVAQYKAKLREHLSTSPLHPDPISSIIIDFVVD